MKRVWNDIRGRKQPVFIFGCTVLLNAVLNADFWLNQWHDFRAKLPLIICFAEHWLVFLKVASAYRACLEKITSWIWFGAIRGAWMSDFCFKWRALMYSCRYWGSGVWVLGCLFWSCRLGPGSFFQARFFGGVWKVEHTSIKSHMFSTLTAAVEYEEGQIESQHSFNWQSNSLLLDVYKNTTKIV